MAQKPKSDAKTKTLPLPPVRYLDGPAPREFGSFLKFCREHENDPEGIVLEVPLDSEGELMQRAAERVFLPKKVQRLEGPIKTGKAQSEALEAQVKTVKAQNEALERDVKALKKRKRPNCDLGKYVALIKEKYPNKASDQMFIVTLVDRHMEKNKKNLLAACPPSWRKVPNFPRLLADALKRTELKNRVKVFISKAG